MLDTDHAAPVSPWLVPTLSAITFISILGTVALSPLLPTMATSLNTSVALLGQIPALAMLVAAALGLVAGPLADQYGHRRALLVGLATIVISAVATGLALTYLLLLLAVLIGAIGRAILIPVSQAVAGLRYSGAAQRRAISWIVSGMSGAGIVGVPLLATIASLSDWRVAFLALGGTALVILLATARLLERDAQPGSIGLDARGVLSAYAPVLRHRPTLGMLIASLIGNAGLWSIATYLGAFFAERHGYTTQAIGWVFLCTGGAFLVGTLLAGGRLSQLPLRPLLTGARVLIAVLLGGALAFPLPALTALALVALGFLVGGAGVVLITLILTAESPAGRATTLTLNGSLFSLGIALGSALGGLLLAVSGYAAIGLAALLLCLGSAGLTWWSRPAPVSVPAPITPPTVAA